MRKLLLWVCLSLFSSLLLASNAADEVALLPTSFDECKEAFLNQKPVRRAGPGEVELCYPGFAVLYNTRTKNAVYSSAFIDGKTLAASEARNLRRAQIEFFADPRIPKAQGAQLSDFKGSGLDRGHLIGNGMATSLAMQEATFSLANVVPQHPINNRKIWAKLERDFRYYLRRTGGSAYYIVGAIGRESQIGKSEVVVPQKLWMLIIPASNKSSYAFVLDNSDTASISSPITQWRLEMLLGFRL